MSSEVHIPKLIAEIAEEIGWSATLRVVEVFAGMDLYVPHSPTEDHPLTALVGTDAAWALARRFGGGRVRVDRCVDILRERRDREIRQRYDAGASVRDLVREYQLTTRHVFRVLGRTDRETMVPEQRVDSRQLRLFDD